jgi:Ni/Co efflux regulator RcnB
MKLDPRRLLLLVLASALLAAPVLGAQAQDGRDEAAAPSTGEDDDVEDVDADADVREEGGQKVKVFRFSGLDISGRLKSPQLLYFLNRLRAEFDRPKLPHRSFVPELVRSTKAPGM